MADLIAIFATPGAWIALLSLTALEIVLGLDNIVFIAILTDRLPEEQRSIAYRLGLGGALVTRIALLLAITWVMGLTDPVFPKSTLPVVSDVSGRDLILLLGGIFLIGKSTHEIYAKVEQVAGGGGKVAKASNLVLVVSQIMVLDIVFSLDSVITAVGMVKEIPIMVTAILIAIAIMLIFAESVGAFVNRHPSMKILALSFLLLIGVLLTAEGMGQHVDKGYIYFAMGFSLVVELLNMRFRKKSASTEVAPSNLTESP